VPAAADGHQGFPRPEPSVTQVVSFDLTILNLGAAFDPTTDAQREQQIDQLCTLLTKGTSGPSAPYENCKAFMRTGIPFGTWNRANSNTVVCRQLHSLLTVIRPEVHCPHSSPGGGNTCIDFPYSSFYDTSYGAGATPKPHHH
jgi:hypothetical protein